MSSAFSVRPYRAGDENGILAGFEEAFDERRSLEEWRWRFQFQDDSPSIAIGVAPSGEIVCQYAVIPMRLQMNGAALGAGQPVDVFCLRRGGTAEGMLYVRTYRRFVRSFCGPGRRFQVLFGFPHDRALRQGQLRMGYPADPPKVPAWSLPVAGKLGSLARRTLSGHRREAGDPWTPEPMDRLWERCRHRYPVTVVRDGDWLARRFSTRPAVSYLHLVQPRDREPRAWGAFCRMGWELRWVDLLWDGTAPADLVVLGERARSIAGRAGCRRLVLWLAGDPAAAAALEGAGWRLRAGQELWFAHRFYDREVSGREEFASRFYVTLGISDLV